MDQIQKLLTELCGVTSEDAPVLTVSLDLSPGPDGIPSAHQVLKQGWRRAEERYGELKHDARRSYLEDQRIVESLQEDAIHRGSMGLFYVGCNATSLQVSLETPHPLRNSVHLGPQPWLFELLRYQYLMSRPIVVALVDLSGVRAVRIAYGEINETIEVEHWEGATTGPHGRTDTQGVGSHGSDGAGASAANAQGGQGAAAADTTGGWHGKTRIEKSILAHKAAYARENAGQLAELAGDGDVLVVAGADEARAELVRQLAGSLRERVIEAPNIDPTTPEARIAEDARNLVIAAQYERAAAQRRLWESGDLGARAVAGVEGVQKAIERGQLGTLLLQEDAVPHLGVAQDAREHEGLLVAETVNKLVRGALSVSAECLITRAEARAVADEDETSAVVGILRWAA